MTAFEAKLLLELGINYPALPLNRVSNLASFFNSSMLLRLKTHKN